MAQGNARGINQVIPLSGDVTGTLDNATVVKLQGRDISSTAPTNGQVLSWNSITSKWTPNTTSSSFKMNIKILDGTSDYTILQNDVCLVENTSNTSYKIYFPQTSPIGRIILISTLFAPTHYYSKIAYAGSTITDLISNDTTGSQYNPYGGLFICKDGSNWISMVQL